MKLRNTLITGFAALALAAVGARAQEIDTYTNPGFAGGNYSDDDLVLSFFSATDATQPSGANSQGDVGFNLGSASSFTGLAPGVYSVAGFNGSATAGQPTLGYGSAEINSTLTVPSSTTFWTVMGSDTTSNQLWLTGVTAQAQQTASTQETIAGRINTIGSAYASNPNADGSAYDSATNTYGYLGSNGRWDTSAVADAAVSSSSDELGLYSLNQNPGGSSTELGFFTLTDTAGTYSLSFTVIPEPSTYAAILGAITVGFVLLRRRFGATGLSLLA
jgi:hypothetical protein